MVRREGIRIAAPRRRLLYHFTHKRHVPSIVAHGLVCDAEARRDRLLDVEAGDRGIKARRRSMRIPVQPGGALDEYVPFYFAPRSPMLNAIHWGRVPQYREGQRPLVYLVTDVDTIIAHALPFVFSNGNCASAFTAYFSSVSDLDDAVDWDLMAERYWADTADDGDRKRRRAAEFLVHGRVPWSAVLGFATMDEKTATEVREGLAQAGATRPVRVRREWYY